MKNWSIVGILLLFLASANAQEEEDSKQFVLGGSLYVQQQTNGIPFSTAALISPSGFYNSSEESKLTNIIFSPYFGKEINSNLLLGLQLGVGLSAFENANARFVNTSVNTGASMVRTGNLERNSKEVLIGVFARRAFNIKSKLNFYLQPHGEFSIRNEDLLLDSDLQQQERIKYLRIGIKTGVLYNISDSFRAVIGFGGLSYLSGNWEVIDTERKNNFSLLNSRLNLSNIGFGFEIRL